MQIKYIDDNVRHFEFLFQERPTEVVVVVWPSSSFFLNRVVVVDVCRQLIVRLGISQVVPACLFVRQLLVEWDVFSRTYRCIQLLLLLLVCCCCRHP